MKKTYQDALAYYGVTAAHPGGFSLTKKILKKVKLNQDTRVLDAGCGIGLTSAYIAKRYGCHVTAIDIHPEMTDKATQLMRAQGVSVHVKEASVEALPFHDGTFDVILVESVLTFTDLTKSLPELKRVLKPGGTILTIEMCGEGSLDRAAREKVKQIYGIPEVLTETAWMNLFVQNGFQKPEVLMRRTVWEEMLSGEASEVASGPTVQAPPNPVFEQIILAHQKLLAAYGDRLGYRAFRVKRP